MTPRLPLALAAIVLALAVQADTGAERPVARTHAPQPPAPQRQTAAEAHAKSAGCMSCHSATDRHTMHQNPAVVLGCTDCHGGDAKVEGPKQGRREDPAYRAALERAHVLPRYPLAWNWPSSANPEGSYTLLNREAPEYIRFVNPGDLRVAREACGACHLPIIQASERSLMSTSAMLWGGAAYNNGILPFKRYILGEAYTREGIGATLLNPVKPTDFLTHKGILPSLTALPSWETIPPADVFRVFERGGRVISSQFPEIGLPNNTGALQRLDEPGRPDIKQSNRGPGTGSRIAVPVINITKTRLNDPHLWFLGTNEQPGDYRSSGCSACHTVYANDRDEKHAGVYAKYGHSGETATKDPTIRRNEPGHPIRHEFTRAIPSSQCMVCHMHQPNVFVNSYYGTIMWDYESDAPHMWPEKQKYPTHEEARKILDRNPEEAAIRGKLERPGVPEERRDPEPEAQGHAVRRLPRPRLELPRRVQARPQGHAPRQGRQGRLRRRSREVQEGGAPHLHPPRRGLPVRRLPLLAGHARQRPHLRRGGGRGGDRLPRLPRHRGQVPDPAHLRAGGAARRHGHVAPADAGRAQALRVARGQALPALGHVPRPRVGDVAREGLGDPRQPEVQREGRAREAHARRRGGPQGRVGPRARRTTRTPTRR